MAAPALVRDQPLTRTAFAAIEAVRTAGLELTNALGQEAELLRAKPLEKQAAILRLMATENPLISGKLYSCSAAEAVVEHDVTYREFCQRVTLATCSTELARTTLVCARLTAQVWGGRPRRAFTAARASAISSGSIPARRMTPASRASDVLRSPRRPRKAALAEQFAADEVSRCPGRRRGGVRGCYRSMPGSGRGSWRRCPAP